MIKKAELIHINAMVNLSYLKRRSYEKVHPLFWKYAGKNAETAQKEWFEKLITHRDFISLIACPNSENSPEIEGFIIGKMTTAPEVYDPGGLTLMIDDFCVKDKNWSSTGQALLNEMKREAQERGVVQFVIVTGAHDCKKKQFLQRNQLNVASEWFVGKI